MLLYINFTYLILIGIPVIAVIAFILSLVRCAKKDKSVLKFAFSALCNNSEQCISNISGNIKLVNELTEVELRDEKVWQQEKLR